MKKLCEVLKYTGIDGKDLRIIERLYWEQLAIVRTEKGNSKNIKIKRGTRQGCVLSPYLFNLFTEMIFGQTITEDGNCDKEIKRRIGQERSAFNTMRDALCCQRLPLLSRLDC